MKKLILLLLILLSAFSAYAVEGALKGKFTVNADGDQVVFSQGNLQYHIGTKTFRFAENQWNYVGKIKFEWDTDTYGNIYENGVKCHNDLEADSTYASWIDLFAWGSGNNPAINRSFDEELDDVEYQEWGANPISNGGNTANRWRTLTEQEWAYIVFFRPNAGNRFAYAIVNGVKGLILLPDNWTTPQHITLNTGGASGMFYIKQFDEDDSWYEGISAKNYWYDRNAKQNPETYKNHFSDNVYTAEQWTKLEANGAIFLPRAGERWKGYVSGVEWGCGYYYSSTKEYYTYSDAEEKISIPFAWALEFVNDLTEQHMQSLTTHALSVRLIRDKNIARADLHAAIMASYDYSTTIFTAYPDIEKKLHNLTESYVYTYSDVAHSTFDQYEEATDAIYKAMDEAKLEVAKEEARKELRNAIATAQKYYNTNSDNADYAANAAALKHAIDEATYIADLSDASKEYIENGQKVLNNELEKAKNEIAEKLAANKAAFDKEKTEQMAAIDALAKDGDSENCQALIAGAKAAIEAMKYDETKTLDANKEQLQPIVDKLKADLEKQRALEELQKSKENLTETVAQAQKYYDDIKNNTDYADVSTALQAAVKSAEETLNKSDATKEELDAANETLEADLQKAKDEVAKIEAEKLLQESKQALSDSIAAANAILDAIGENEEYADLIAEMRAVVDAAQAVLDNPESTQEEIDAAIEQLARAAAKARASIGTHEDIDQIVNDKMRKYENEKIIIGGQLLILRNGKTYTVLGQEVK